MKRWWGIRHVRFIWHACQVFWRADVWASRGIGIGGIHPADQQFLWNVWNGKA